jgi:hypothetical protein
MTGSTVGIPSSGLYSITLNDQNGQPISQSSFGWTRNGNVISINNPAAVKNWMSSRVCGHSPQGYNGCSKVPCCPIA